MFTWGAVKFNTLGRPYLRKDEFIPTLISGEKIYQNFRNYQMKYLVYNDLYEEGDDNQRLGEEKLDFDAFDLKYQQIIITPEQMEDPDSSIDPIQRLDIKIIKIFSSENNTAFLDNFGNLYMAGQGNFGQLTLSPDTKGEEVRDNGKLPEDFVYLEDEAAQTRTLFTHSPLYLPINIDVKFKSVALGAHHVVAITTEGTPYSWGKNTEGQLGLGYASKFVSRPQEIEEISLKVFKMCAASNTYSAMLSEADGELWVFGTAEHGCLGINDIKSNYDVLAPKLVNDLDPIIYIACGPQHMACITKDGKILTWGNKNNGRLARPDDDVTLLPGEAKYDDTIANVKFKQVACGYMHTIALDGEGYIWGCGAKAYAGQILAYFCR
eukprot:CAMPEP_0114581614 /NCGR_PEP_ID=MMETSP0125-20121206/5699_1 /TAXON_ID=485358 ORGANISM="Aristerostoma sp., Strain ATCC 50986" /NCGR_SAMPLE_ID=MMETSP0125 /ASSEMBLY_ACC=CAM_ASM_000245 /LENGTH=379 /DNA_ID=CAMNT_0001773951 /DNA_START=1203 /DNA_END=2342 /DNA_ORIENTATION=-